MPLSPPVLSEFDPVSTSEGSIDPLSLSRIYDHLADRMLPALTVRMSRIRFITAIAVGAVVCAKWEEEDLASDGLTPPWLVFEWFVVESFVRARADLRPGDGPLRLAGRNKVENAVRAHRPVSASTYLKTPTVFGFTGIFRRLVERSCVVNEGLGLDDAGYELVRAWEEDQGLDGFIEGRSGDGARLRDALRRAVTQGMEKGRTVDQGAEFWSEVATRLDPGRIGRAEQKQIDAILRGSPGDEALGFAREVIRAVEQQGGRISYQDEVGFLRALAPDASPGLAQVLKAIDAYEGLCRPITDAFDLVRHLSTGSGGAAVGPADFAEHRDARAYAKAVRAAVERLRSSVTLHLWEPEVQAMIDRYQEVSSAEELFRAVLAHHEAAQQDKPPDGKRPWLERSRGDRFLVRTAYQVPEAPGIRKTYAHEYRVPTLSLFLRDLGRLR